MPFYLYRENKLEVLARRFVDEVYNVPSADLLLERSLQVVVQTRGMSEYLRQYVAAECGIAADLEMPFLNSFINQICRSIYGDDFKYASLRSDQKNMRRELMKLLSDVKFVEQEVPELKKYLSGSNRELKRWQLAGKTADLFDQYQLYRSKELYDGTLFDERDFQGRLYRKLFDAARPGRDHFFERLRREGVRGKSGNLPREISIFGVGALPPVYLDILVNLSEVCRVNFFYLSPCLEYWEYQFSRREQRQQPWSIAEAGNPILQALGRQGRSFFSALLANNRIAPDWEPELRAPDDDPGKTMLEIMQHDILYLFDRRTKKSDHSEDDTVGMVRADLKNDRSIAIHNCHSIRRELEVLHDELLKLIINDHIEPHRVIVMAPDIEKLAPVIRAVFGNGALKDVYSIADLPQRSHVMASDAFHRIFSVASGRFEYSDVMALLDLPFISEVMALPEGKLTQFGKILYDAGVRWGFDGAMRKRFCGNDFDEFSWRMAIDRVLAGFTCRSYGNIAPLIGNVKICETLPVSDMEYFAVLVRFVENLGSLAQKLLQAHPMDEWVQIFSDVCKDFFSESNLQRTALMPLRSALNELEQMSENGFLPGEYPLAAALAILDDHWEISGENSRFLRGKITFCRMVPMRSIPHDVVAILDLNEGDFPRRSVSVGFDMIELHRQNGDRSLPVQDRYLLLEAIMSARKNLLLFYQGRSSRNNQDKPACAPLSEIMHYLENAFELKEYKHKLSGIDQAYFVEDAPYPSLDMDHFRTVRNIARGFYRGVPRWKMPELYDVPKWQNSVTIDEMVDFFSNPCRWIMRNQLGVIFTRENLDSGDDEPWVLERYKNWQVDSLLVDMELQQRSNAYDHALRSNLLPPGKFGEQAFEERRQLAGSLPENWKEWLQNSCRMPLCTDLLLEKSICKVSGMVNCSNDLQQVLVYRFSAYKAASALAALFGALTATIAWKTPVGARILNLGTEGFEERCIEPFEVKTAEALLSCIITQAMHQRSEVIPLFPESSVHYRDEKLAGEKFYKFIYNGDDRGDVCDKNISYFYTPEDWQDVYCSDEFNYWAELLYSHIRQLNGGSR